MTSSPLPPDALGERLQRALGDDYQVRDLLGRGGFAAVYAATDRRLRRDVAIKVLREDLDAPVFRERFRREAEAVAGLRHPHIIPIYAVGEAEGLAWFIMPLIRGDTLRQRLRRDGELTIALARRVMLEAAGALAAAHRAGLVHRDIKPDNIALDGDDERVIVMDFGIAKALGGDGAGLTATGMIIGTPEYMSPEQAGGEGAVDHRADLYALGVVGFQLLTGELPYRATSLPALLVKQMTEPVPSVERRRRDCPAPLAAAIEKCLAKLPDERWASAEELVRALEGATTSSTPTGVLAAAAATVPASPGRRFRALAVGLFAVSVLLLAIDALDGRIQFAPIAFLVSAFIVAASYGRLWSEGYGWRDLLDARRDTGHPSGRVTTVVGENTPADAALGTYAEALRSARYDRTTTLSLIEQLPRAERALLPPVAGVLDELLAETAETARRLHALEARSAASDPATLQSRSSGLRAQAPSPMRDRTLTMIERQRATLEDLQTRREQASRRLEACLNAMQNVRFEVEHAHATGVQDALVGIRLAIERASECAHHTGGQ